MSSTMSTTTTLSPLKIGNLVQLDKVEFALFSLSFEKIFHEWQHLGTSKHIYHRHWNTFPVVISKFFGKKTEYYCDISVDSINGTAKYTGWPRRFDLKCFRNFLIRIEIIIVNHICIFFYHVLTLYDSILPPRYRSWYNIWHKVPPRGKNIINIWLPVIIP